MVADDKHGLACRVASGRGPGRTGQWASRMRSGLERFAAAAELLLIAIVAHTWLNHLKRTAAYDGGVVRERRLLDRNV
eukprot:3254170-Prymnesium_polylepis.1